MLKGKTALVTGSTGGIGEAFARAFAAQGCNVMMNGLGEAAAIEKLRADIAKEHGVEVAYHGADVGVPAEIEAMVREAERRFGGVDILVNNAVVRHYDRIEDFPVEKWDRAMAVDLSAAFHTIRLTIRRHEGARLGPHHQHVVDPRPHGGAEPGGLRHRQARADRAHALRRARDRGDRRDDQRADARAGC